MLYRLNLKLDVPDEEIDNKFREQFFNFYDDRLMDLAWAKQPNPDHTIQFFRLLALCNTIIPDGRCATTNQLDQRTVRPPDLANLLASMAVWLIVLSN